MLPKTDKFLRIEDVRTLVLKLVKGEEYVSDSKMVAYDKVGADIGRSGSWVRKFIAGRDVGLQFDQFAKIAGAYDRLCTRIEKAAAAERARADHLRRIADALDQSVPGMGASDDAAPSG